MDNASFYPKKTKNLYHVLGATADDAPEILKRKYIALAKKSHPDIFARDSSIDFSEVAAAYKVLSDPVQRRKYDRQLMANNWTEIICYLLGGMAEFFIFFLQVLSWPFSQEILQDGSTQKEEHLDTDDWFFASIA